MYARLALILLSLTISSATYGDQAKGKRIVAVIDTDGVQRVEIIGGDYYFDPNYIIVKANVPVEFKARKEPGIVPHNILIEAPEAGINFNDNMGREPKIIRFTPTKPGKYPIICNKRFLFFKSHKDKGMVGTLEVVE